MLVAIAAHRNVSSCGADIMSFASTSSKDRMCMRRSYLNGIRLKLSRPLSPLQVGTNLPRLNRKTMPISACLTHGHALSHHTTAPNTPLDLIGHALSAHALLRTVSLASFLRRSLISVASLPALTPCRCTSPRIAALIAALHTHHCFLSCSLSAQATFACYSRYDASL